MTKSMEKEIELNRKRTMTKKQYKDWLKTQRTLVYMNTGTRTHRSKKDYNRQKAKQAVKEAEV